MVLYHEKFKDYTLIYHHTLSDKSLPMIGWIHNCYNCNSATSKEINYNYKKNKYKVIICKDCAPKFLENNKKINKYIERYFSKKKLFNFKFKKKLTMNI
tara:strand:+ start:299 stop:595 length:297 start_codon:yes stop_codon:yes gene_type:complete